MQVVVLTLMQIERELLHERKTFAKKKLTLRCESKAGPILALAKSQGNLHLAPGRTCDPQIIRDDTQAGQQIRIPKTA